MDRRGLLVTLASFGMTAIAGCSGDGDTGGSTDSPTKDPTATPSRTPTPDAKRTVTDTSTPTPSAAITIEAGPSGELRFEPAEFTIRQRETVRWVFRSRGHNVKPESIPEGADWTGTPGDKFEPVPEGSVHRATFDVAGWYEYACVPHRSAGMVGSFTVE